MAEVKWIKIVTDVFNNRKIKQIETMPDADSLLVIWFKILCLSGNINENGMMLLTKDVPYTEEMLANEFRRPVNTIRLALQIFVNFGMIEIIDNIYCVSNWEKYQNIESLEKIRENTRLRVQKHRDKQKQLIESNVTVTLRNATEEERDKEEDKERDKEEDIKIVSIPYKEIVALYNKICDLPKVKTITDKRKIKIKVTFNEFGLEQIEEIFTKAKESDFLSGRNGRWTGCNFDWLINYNNAVKVLEGTYNNKSSGLQKQADVLGEWLSD